MKSEREIQVYETNSPDETYEIGKQMAQKAEAGTVFCLDGDLGVGKTVFTQGFAAGLGIEEPVTVLRLRLCRCTNREDFRSIILMYTESMISMKCMRLGAKNIFTGKVCALLSGHS